MTPRKCEVWYGLMTSEEFGQIFGGSLSGENWKYYRPAITMWAKRGNLSQLR